MPLNPFDALRRWRRFRARVREEVGFIIERHGPQALDATLQELNKPDLSPRRAKILKAAAKTLKT
jgi:hypothetical protein